MSFEKINNLEIKNDEKNLVVLYNFTKKEVTIIKNICNLLGIKNTIILSKENSNSKLIDIVNNKFSNSSEDGFNEKCIVFNNIHHTKISGLNDNLKKFKIKRPLMAITTSDNISWTLNELIYNLIKERSAINKGETLNH